MERVFSVWLEAPDVDDSIDNEIADLVESAACAASWQEKEAHLLRAAELAKVHEKREYPGILLRLARCYKRAGLTEQTSQLYEQLREQFGMRPAMVKNITICASRDGVIDVSNLYGVVSPPSG